MGSSVQVLLQTLWCEILDLDESDVTGSSHFFELGGDSVAAIRLTAAANEHGLSLDSATVFEHPELDAMAGRCVDVKQIAETPSKHQQEDDPVKMHDEVLVRLCEKQCNISRDSIEDIFPCTAQQQLVMTSFLEKNMYFNQMVFDFAGSETLLQDAWTLLQHRNPILRTRIIDNGGAHLQVVLRETSKWAFALNLDDYKTQDAKVRPGFGTPLARYAIVREGSRTYFVWTFLQALVDGWTKVQIFQDLATCFVHPGSFAERIAPRPSFRNFTNYVSSLDRTAGLAFWDRRLKGVDQHNMLFPYSREPFITSGEASRVIVDVAFPYQKMQRSRSSITFSTVAHVAWALVLCHESSASKAFFVSKRSGRQCALPGVGSILGPIITHTPFVVELRTGESIVSLLKRVQEDIMAGVPFEPFGWEALIRRFGPGRYCPCLLIPQAPGTDAWAAEMGGTGGGTMLRPNEDLSNMEDMGVGMLMDLRPRGGKVLNLLAEFDMRIMGERRMRALLEVYGKLLWDVAEAVAGGSGAVTAEELLQKVR
ncbi:MAG: hypothetical protein L6R40_003480 [Gallowayella cf. fulva]|nr:MAG: hypothetical protein L6R40_003480 [Xanthomendoza cf. fulva]